MFDYDWFYGSPYEQHKQDALIRVAQKKFPDKDRKALLEDDACRKYMDKLESRPASRSECGIRVRPCTSGKRRLQGASGGPSREIFA